MADPDFWTDWSAWGIELSIGVAILAGAYLAGNGNLFGRKGLKSAIRGKLDNLPGLEPGSRGRHKFVTRNRLIIGLILVVIYAFGWVVVGG